MKHILTCIFAIACLFGSVRCYAQDHLPEDNGLVSYHTEPRYRESESHPLRVLAYIFHPVGWVLREVIFRPLSYFASSTEETRSVMGYREPFDYRQPECFTADDTSPDCRAVMPFNYNSNNNTIEDEEDSTENSVSLNAPSKEIFFPNVNFDFDKHTLNTLGKGRAKQIAESLQGSGAPVKVVLQGHTDYMGTDAYNQKLGMDRAEAVRTELVSLGISPERLSTVSFGESRPLKDEKTDAARAENRRVEVHAE